MCEHTVSNIVDAMVHTKIPPSNATIHDVVATLSIPKYFTFDFLTSSLTSCFI
jgi:hypothetical protein